MHLYRKEIFNIKFATGSTKLKHVLLHWENTSTFKMANNTIKEQVWTKMNLKEIFLDLHKVLYGIKTFKPLITNTLLMH